MTRNEGDEAEVDPRMCNKCDWGLADTKRSLFHTTVAVDELLLGAERGIVQLLRTLH